VTGLADNYFTIVDSVEAAVSAVEAAAAEAGEPAGDTEAGDTEAGDTEAGAEPTGGADPADRASGAGPAGR
jgi:hypothetical protein